MSVREIAAAAFFGVLLLAAHLAARLASRRAASLLWPFAVGLLIAYEAILLNVLSLFHAVTAIGVLGGNVLAILLIALFARRLGVSWVQASPTFLWRSFLVNCGSRGACFMVLPLAVILGVTAVIFPPMNWDSMTYHMARVAHWIQNGSIAYYPTLDDRQNWLGPGAEYLILVLQSLAGSDRWANSIQFLSWAAIVMTTPALCRVVGVPRRLCTWAMVFGATVPMVVLQATSTQNDLVASVLCLGLIVACLPFSHRRRQWRCGDLILLIVLLGAAFLTKPTALVAALPALVYAGLNAVRLQIRQAIPLRRMVRDGAFAVLLGGSLFVPDIARKLTSPTPLFVPGVVYSGLHEGRLRLCNILAGGVHHALPGSATSRALRIASRALGIAPVMQARAENVFSIHEDCIGNPLHYAFAVIAGLWIALTIRWIPRRARFWSALPVLSWVAFHCVFRDQVFFSRLQTPLFVVLPLTWAASRAARRNGALAVRSVLLALSVTSAAYAYVCASNNEGKTLKPPALAKLDQDAAYYLHNFAPQTGHEATLKALARQGCRRLGLFIDIGSYDYPLTWRAMKAGVEVRYYMSPSTWPCLVFSDRGVPQSQQGSPEWVNLGNGVFVPGPEAAEPPATRSKTP